MERVRIVLAAIHRLPWRCLMVRIALALPVIVSLESTMALARCPKDCRQSFKTQRGTCKDACPQHKPGKECREACSEKFKASKAMCRSAATPTTPYCGTP